MKKSLAIGAASVALAAMPIVGVFATEQEQTITDTLRATVSTACMFTRWGEAGAANQVDTTTGDVAPAWSGAASGAADTVTGIYSATFKPGMDVELGTSHFSGYCNDANGFTITVATPDLATSTGAGAKTIPFAGTTPDSTNGEGWTLTKSGSGGLVTATGATFIDGSAGPSDASDPLTETATYTVYTKSTTKSGTYTADVVYTFTYEDPNAS